MGVILLKVTADLTLADACPPCSECGVNTWFSLPQAFLMMVPSGIVSSSYSM